MPAQDAIGSDQVVRRCLVVVEIRAPVGEIVFPEQSAGLMGQVDRDPARHDFRPIEVEGVACRCIGRQERLDQVHVGVLPPVGIDD
jgi:hypothetical protein